MGMNQINQSFSHMLLYVFLIRLCVGATIICSEEEECVYGTLTCGGNEACNIICNGTGSCRSSQFICKEGYECNVMCISGPSQQSPCFRATVTCPSNANCNINCSGGYETCIESNIVCPSNGNCSVNCTGDGSCRYADISCPDNGDCDIICGKSGCQQTSIACPIFGDCNIECGQSGCKEANIDCSSLSDNQCNIGCLDYYSCMESTIQASDSGNFHVTCPKTQACRGMNLICPQNAECLVECDMMESCYNASIDARHSSELQITGCTVTRSCAELSIWAPANSGGNKTCHLEGDDDLNQLTIYAVNGWNDIDISSYIGSTYSGVMYCNSDYSNWCNVSDLSWNCSNTSSICVTINNQTVPTLEPTAYPTGIPTNSPTETTANPTTGPVQDTANPTLHPTAGPTLYPTVNSTAYDSTYLDPSPTQPAAGISPKQHSLYLTAIIAVIAHGFV